MSQEPEVRIVAAAPGNVLKSLELIFGDVRQMDRNLRIQSLLVDELPCEGVLEARVEQVRAVTDELSGVPLLAQQGGYVVRATEIDGLPAVVGPSDGSGGNVRAVGDRREAPRIETPDLRGALGGELIEGWRANRASRPAAQIVKAIRVGHKQDDVPHTFLRFPIWSYSSLPAPQRPQISGQVDGH